MIHELAPVAISSVRLVPKLQLGHAIGSEVSLRRRGVCGPGAPVPVPDTPPTRSTASPASAFPSWSLGTRGKSLLYSAVVARKSLQIMRGFFPLLFILFSTAAIGAEASAWEIWDDCRVEASQYFDGDSFHVRHGSEDAILRLYFVDAPETESGHGGRVAEQATYFHVTDAQVLTAGRTAKEFTEQFLARPFRVITRRQGAPGASRGQRYYAIVESNGRRLDAALIEAGLARVSGEIADYPDASAGHKTVQELRLGEQKAANAHRGLWAHTSGLVERVTEQAGEAVKARLKKIVDNGVAKVKDKLRGDKENDPRLNLNSATTAELEGLPGIGPKTAESIIQARPIKNLEALGTVRGIGPKKIEALRDLVRFE